MTFIKTKHIPPGDSEEIIKFWFPENKKHVMTRAEAEKFLEVETKKAPMQKADLVQELKARDMRIEELEAKVQELIETYPKDGKKGK